MTRRLPPTGRTARSPPHGPSIRDASPLAVAASTLSTLAAFTAVVLLAEALEPVLSPSATLLGFWLVGLPAAFAAPVVGVRLAARARRRLRRFACARWRVGCEPLDGAGRAA